MEFIAQFLTNLSFRATLSEVEGESRNLRTNWVPRSLDFARDDSIGGNLKQDDKLKFEDK